MNSLVCTFTLLLCPAFCANSDLLAPEAQSWISNDNFMIIVDLSFPYSVCCNVYLSGTIGKSEVLFNQFRSIYPYEYLLNRSSYECDGYLLLGSSDEEIEKFMEKVLLEWKTEILVVVDNYVANDSNIFNRTLYGTANLNIISLSGVWRLSENYIKPRVFIQIDRFKEMRHNYENVNLHGRELKVCSIYRPPMTYFNRTVMKMIDGEQVEVFAVDTDTERDGVEMQLFLIMAEKLNFTWTIRKPEGIYTYGSRVNETEWKGGMIQLLLDNKVDIAFGGIWVTQDQNTFVHLSEPSYQLHLHFLVPRPHRTTTFWALTRPFSGEVWCLFLSAVLFHSLYTCTRAWIDPKYPKRFRNFLITLTDLIGSLLSSSVSKTVANNKLQIILWSTAGWLIIAAYCSSLAARLASSEYEKRIDTMEQFLAANLTWGKMGQVPPFRDYFDLTDPYSAQLPSRYRYVENDGQSRDLIARGGYAIFGKVYDNCFFPEDNVPNEELKNYRLMKQSAGSFYAAYALQPWLLKPVNRMLLLLKESGITTWHLRDIIRKRDSYNLREVLVEHDGYDGSVQVLGLTPLGAGFSMLVVGFSIATVVFYLELKRAAGSSVLKLEGTVDSKRRRRNKKKILKIINKKKSSHGDNRFDAVLV